MKNLFIAAGFLSIFFVSCKEDDITPPKFTMHGESTITISLNTPFHDPGVDAEDNEDGAINVTSDASATNPNVDLTGHYIITYTATDGEGNTDKITRNVIVVNDAAFMAGGYDVDVPDSCGFGLDYVDGIIPSTSHNNRIIFNQIGRCSNASIKLEADLDFATSTVTIIDAVINCGTFPAVYDRHFSGGGALVNNNTVIQIDVTEFIPSLGTTTTCTYTYVRQ